MATSASSETREVTLNIRTKRRDRDLIDRAAETLGKSRSEFMLETACREAQAVLLDRRYFALDDERFQAFLNRLDEPVAPTKLRKLLTSKAPWEG